jgi:hypothetical protein
LGVCGLLAALALQGCSGSSQTREQQIAATQEAQSQEDDAKCKAAGATPNTPAYEQCRENLVQKRMQDEAAQVRRREAFQKTLGEGTSAASGL